MPVKTKKSVPVQEVSSTQSQPVVTEPQVVASEPEVPVVKQSKKSSKSSVKSVVSEVPVVSDVPVVVKKEKEEVFKPVVDSEEQPSVPVDIDIEEHLHNISERTAEFFGKLQQVNVLISALKTDFRALEKSLNRELKVAQKASSRRKRKAGNRAPSGFVKPTKISDELALFLGKDKGSEMARTEVTREINAYIKTNNLQEKTNRKLINPDEGLLKLLKIPDTEQLSYFNLQKYMSPHFAKSVPVVAVV